MTIDASDAFRVAVELDAMGVRAGARAYAVVQHHGALLQTRVKARMALPRTHPRGPGTGGPRLITGDLSRSVTLQMSLQGGNPTAEVGSNRPQAHRLEVGFSGPDSLGRVFHQPPYPAWGPAVDDVTEPFTAAIAALADG